MATYEYNPNTGAKLKPGETVWDVANNRLITQGQQYGSGSAYTSAQNAAAQGSSASTTTAPSSATQTPSTAYTPVKTTTAPATSSTGIDYDAISKQIAEIQAKTQAIASQVPTATKTSTAAQPTASQPAKPANTISQPTTSTADATAQMNKTLETIRSTYEKSQQEQNKLLTSLKETTSTQTLDAIKRMQESSQASLNEYISQQNALIEQIQNQPSAVESLQKFREQQGLPQMEQELASIDQTILTTETLLNNIESDIRTRTEGLPVSESAARRLTAMEQAPLSKQLSEQLTARQRIAAGLEAKQNTVSQFMNAQQEDLAKTQSVINAKLGVSETAYGAKVDIAKTGYQLFSDLQDKLNTIDLQRIDMISNQADKQASLEELGFNSYMQMRAEEIAKASSGEEFNRQLSLIKLESDLNQQNPDYYTTIETDSSSGQVYQISINKNNPSDKVVQSLGIVGETGKGSDTTGISEERSYQMQTAQRVIDSVDSIMNQVNWTTTGLVGGLTSIIAGSPAYDLKAAIKQLQANIGFNELQSMRNASPTGGALGQVSERELDLLSSVLGNLDISQSTNQLRTKLGEIKTHFDNWKMTLDGVNPDNNDPMGIR